METRHSQLMIRRILAVSVGLQILITATAAIFTKDLACSIMAFSAALIAQLGFLVMIRALDRTIRRRRGTASFFMVSLVKMTVIAGFFLLASRISEQAVLFSLFGLSVVVLAVLVEGAIQLLRSLTHGRAQAGHR